MRTVRGAASVAGWLLAAGIVIALLLSSAVPVGSGSVGDKPDLVPLLPTAVSSGQMTPVFVDGFQLPGRLLYRFDSVLENRGGVLDLFRDPVTGHALQAIWAGGTPSSQPDPNVAPSGPAVMIEDRAAAGASFAYSTRPGHQHWHFAPAAVYELLVPGRAARVAAKISFCMSDTYGTPVYFQYGYVGQGPNTFCAPDDPSARFVRMGISPDVGDYYWAQLGDQWIDVTGLPPGRYTLRAIANPVGAIDESNTGNNVVEQTRTIPGTTATPVSETVHGGSSRIRLSGAVVAPEIPARRNPGCQPSRYSSACYLSTSAKEPLRFQLARFPAHGAVSIISERGHEATALYAPNRGYSGRDSFTYTVTDSRGLRSVPATVRLRVLRSRRR